MRRKIWRIFYMQRMIDLGVDGIITDYPDRLLELMRK